MSNPDWSSIVRRLSAREAALRELLATPRQAATDHEVADFKDAASAYADDQVRAGEALQWEQELGQVLAALRRLTDHTYGLCEGCGQKIDPARLEALPEAALCSPCQEARERPGRRG